MIAYGTKDKYLEQELIKVINRENSSIQFDYIINI
jgi:hypothetical protein